MHRTKSSTRPRAITPWTSLRISASCSPQVRGQIELELEKPLIERAHFGCDAHLAAFDLRPSKARHTAHLAFIPPRRFLRRLRGFRRCPSLKASPVKLNRPAGHGSHRKMLLRTGASCDSHRKPRPRVGAQTRQRASQRIRVLRRNQYPSCAPRPPRRRFRRRARPPPEAHRPSLRAARRRAPRLAKASRKYRAPIRSCARHRPAPPCAPPRPSSRR